MEQRPNQNKKEIYDQHPSVNMKLPLNSNWILWVGTELYCFRVKIHCYYYSYIIFSSNPVKRS